MEITVKFAKETTGGGLTNVSKMPCKTYNLPTDNCKVGSKLRKVSGSVCSDCYACKGNYTMYPAGEIGRRARLDSIASKTWIPSMVKLLEKEQYFRWHSSGDLQGMKHLKAIVSIAEQTPNTLHWIPTKEKALVQRYLKTNKLPENLNIRLSAPMLDQRVPNSVTGTDSMVIDETKAPKGVHVCPAPKQGGECRDCRACWDKKTKTVAYHRH